MEDYEFKVGWCMDCDQGWIEIVKGKKTDLLLLECSECSTQWRNIGARELAESTLAYTENILDYIVFDIIMSLAEEQKNYVDEDDEDFDSIKTIQTIKPTLNQIKQKQWDRYILQN